MHHCAGTTVSLVHIGMGLQPEGFGDLHHFLYVVAVDYYSLSFSLVQASLGGVVNAEEGKGPYLLLLIELDRRDGRGSGAVVLTGMVRYLLRKLETWDRSEEHTSELQSRQYLVCRLLLEKK